MSQDWPPTFVPQNGNQTASPAPWMRSSTTLCPQQPPIGTTRPRMPGPFPNDQATSCQATPAPPYMSMDQTRDELQDRVSNYEAKLQDVMTERSKTPASNVRLLQEQTGEIESLMNALQCLKIELERKDQELSQNRRVIQQQEETIHVQSQALSNPRGNKFENKPFVPPSKMQNDQSNAKHSFTPYGYHSPQKGLPNAEAAPFTPRRGVSNYTNIFGVSQYPQMTLDQAQGVLTPSRSRNMPPSTVAAGLRAGAPTPFERQNGHRRNVSELTNPFENAKGVAKPPQLQQFSSNTNSTNTDSSSSFSMIQSGMQDMALMRPSTATSQVASDTGTAPTSSVEKMTEAFNDLIDTVVRFSYTHVNSPSTSGDGGLAPELKKLLIDRASPNTAARLMSTQDTRYFLVSKIILSWMFDNIFASSSFFGLDLGIDKSIDMHRGMMSNPNTHGSIRHIYLNSIRASFVRLRSNEQYNQFMGHLVQSRAKDLWKLIQPMMHRYVPKHWEDLYAVVAKGHQVAEAYFGTSTEYRFIFPRLQDEFNEMTMVNMDPKMGSYTVEQIEQIGARVVLGALPQILARKTDQAGNVTTNTIVKAGILLHIPQKNGPARR